MTSAGIGNAATLPTTDLNLFHKNPRIGNVAAIAGSLAANGQYRPIVVNKGTHTGRPNEVLAGNHTLKAIRLNAENNPEDTRWHYADCWVVDVDDDRATKIVLADNRTAELGHNDDQALLALLESVDHDLDGSGYNYDDMDELRNLLDSLDEDVPHEGADDTQASSRELQDEVGGDMEVVDVLWGEPKTEVHAGERWKLTTSSGTVHYLVIANLGDQHESWSDLLQGRFFAPYPDVYLTTSELRDTSMLLVQPNLYLAGHLLDKHQSVFGPDSIEKVENND